MPPPRAKALDMSDLRSSHQGMVPHTPNSMPGPWPVYHREFDDPQGQVASHGSSAAVYQHFSANPGYGMPSPRVVRHSQHVCCYNCTWKHTHGRTAEVMCSWSP